MLRRVLPTLLMALLLVGCGAPWGEPVQLLIGVDPNACYAGGETGATNMLIEDATYGTSFGGRPVMWPIGFTGRRVAGQVQVLDAGGKVRATTGRTYHMSMGYVSSEEARHMVDLVGAFPVAVLCGYPWDFVDCDTPAPDVARYCRQP